MIVARCRRFGEVEWTEISFNGPMAKLALLILAGGLTPSGQYHAQYMGEEGDWIDIAEMDFDDGKFPE